jgi:predicted nucleic acid-binding protein
MMIAVDTSVWSLALRRRQIPWDNPWVAALRDHLVAGDKIVLVGPIIQELLSGVREQAVFAQLEAGIRWFPLLDLDRSTYVAAARLTNRCLQDGYQPGAVDVLIAAACIERACPLLTADTHFLEIAKRCQLVVLPPLGK